MSEEKKRKRFPLTSVGTVFLIFIILFIISCFGFSFIVKKFDLETKWENTQAIEVDPTKDY